MSATATNSSDSAARRNLPLLAGALVVLLLAAMLAWWRLKPAPQAGPASAPAASAAAPAPLSASQVERGIANAREAVQRNPKDAGNWAMLAHSYEMLGRFEQAGEAYRQLLALRPQDAQVHADFAGALGVAQRGSLQGEPAKLIGRALTLDPQNLKALVLAGKEAFERRRYEEAIGFWQRAQAVTQDTAVRHAVETSMAEARALLRPGATAPAGTAFITGRITLAAALKDRAGPDDAVFVFARRTEGSRMPVALLRKRVRDLPLDFALDDTLAMVPDARLSQQKEVIVGVRISRRGDAIPASGDLEGETGPVKVGSSGLQIEINRARP